MRETAISVCEQIHNHSHHITITITTIIIIIRILSPSSHTNLGGKKQLKTLPSAPNTPPTTKLFVSQDQLKSSLPLLLLRPSPLPQSSTETTFVNSMEQIGAFLEDIYYFSQPFNMRTFNIINCPNLFVHDTTIQAKTLRLCSAPCSPFLCHS